MGQEDGMPAAVPDRMVEAAIRLLARHGYQAASFGAVLEQAKAPRGSIYYHFPGGKSQLVAAAIEVAGERAISLVQALRGRSAEEIIDGFVSGWRSVLDYTGFSAGCSAVAVTVSADAPELVDRVGVVFRSWQQAIADVLELAGLSVRRAQVVSLMMLAACEGAVVLCRAQRSLEPLDIVADQLKVLAASTVE